MRFPDARRLPDGRWELLTDYAFQTGITGHDVTLSVEGKQCDLRPDGTLTCRKGFIWDLASGAIDTPDMIVASLAHDAFCYLTNHKVLDWSVRAEADALFKALLESMETNFIRRWYSYLMVRAYSLTFAHKDRV